jgi:hypothetical protein
VPQVAARAQRRQIRRVVVGRVLVQMGANQHRFTALGLKPPFYCPQWGRAKPPPLGGSLSILFCCGWLHK